jgi:hypothetical protein
MLLKEEAVFNSQVETQIQKIVKAQNPFPGQELIEFKNKTIWLNTHVILPKIELTNRYLKEKIGDFAPQLTCFTNIEGLADKHTVNRYFTQIYFIYPDADLNLLTDPYLLCETFSKKSTVDILWSDLNNVHNKHSLPLNDDLSKAFLEVFSLVFLDFIENNFNLSKNISTIPEIEHA